MKTIIFTFVLIAFLATTIVASPARPGGCAKACTLDYTPICATPESGRGKDLSFGNKCVLENYNCEHPSAKYKVKSSGECPGGAGIRLQ